MKLILLLITLISLSASRTDGEVEVHNDAVSSDCVASTDYLSPAEKEMIQEINLVRTQPWSYRPIILAELEKVQQDSVALSKIMTERIHKRISQINGLEVIEIDTVIENYYDNRVTAIRELLAELQSSSPLNGLTPYEPLYSAAVYHVSNQNNPRFIDPLGPDGSGPQDRILKAAPSLTGGNENIAHGVGSPREMIVQLLIDSGAPHRGHRKNILAPEWKYITCYHARELDEHSAQWWVQEFAY